MNGLTLFVLLAGALASPPVGSRLARRARRHFERRSARRRSDHMGEYCYAVGRRLHAGETLAQALAVGMKTPPLAEPVSRLLDEHSKGATLGRAAQRWSTRDRTPEVELFATAVELAAERVGHQPMVFERVAGMARARHALRAEVRTQAAGAVASVWVVAALPWVVGLLLVSAGGPPADLLLRTSLGWTLICAAAALEALGVLWMRMLVRRAVPIAGR